MRKGLSSMPGLAAAGAALLLSLGGTARAGLLDLFGGERETLGPFEIRTHESSHWVGVWETRVKTASYSIRHRGRAIQVTAPATQSGGATPPEQRFNAVVSFASAQPALLVNAGYPFAASHYYLLREDQGGLRIEYVGPARSDDSTAAEDWAPVQWLEQQPAPPPADGQGLHGRMRMDGGRWLIAGLFALIDTQTLQVHRLGFPPPRAYRARILMRSPDGWSFVRLAGGGDFPEPAQLLVFSLREAQPYGLTIDARRMRYRQITDFEDPQWLDHHFEWRGDAARGDRLVERAAFTPLPRAGRVEGGSQGAEYVLDGVDAAMASHFLRFVEHEFGGRSVEHADAGAADSGPTLEHWRYIAVGDTVLALMYVDHAGELRVWRHRGRDEGLIETVARPFDAALRAGRFD